MFADFHGVSTPSKANFRLPTRQQNSAKLALRDGTSPITAHRCKKVYDFERLRKILSLLSSALYVICRGQGNMNTQGPLFKNDQQFQDSDKY